MSFFYLERRKEGRGGNRSSKDLLLSFDQVYLFTSVLRGEKSCQMKTSIAFLKPTWKSQANQPEDHAHSTASASCLRLHELAHSTSLTSGEIAASARSRL